MAAESKNNTSILHWILGVLVGILAFIALAVLMVFYLHWQTIPTTVPPSPTVAACDASLRVEAIWGHRGFNAADLTPVATAVNTGSNRQITYNDSYFWSNYASDRESGNAKAFIRDMFPNSQAFGLVMTMGKGYSYLVLTADCDVRAIYLLTPFVSKPAPVKKKAVIQQPKPTVYLPAVPQASVSTGGGGGSSAGSRSYDMDRLRSVDTRPGETVRSDDTPNNSGGQGTNGGNNSTSPDQPGKPGKISG